MTRESMIKVLRYKAEHIKTHIKPEFFLEVAEALEQEPTEPIKAVSLDRVKQVRAEISDWDVNKVMDGCSEPFKLGVAKGLDIASVILDKLTESEEAISRADAIKREKYGFTDADIDKYAVQVQNGEGYYNSCGEYVSYNLD